MTNGGSGCQELLLPKTLPEPVSKNVLDNCKPATMTRLARWLAATLRRKGHQELHGPACANAPRAMETAPVDSPGPVLRAVGGLSCLLAVLTLVLCVTVMLFCLISLVTGLFTR
jgi:hypothetical protein